jgi:gingipain R
MKKLIFGFSILCVAFTTFAQRQTSYEILENNTNTTIIAVQVGELMRSEVNTPKGKSLKVNIPQATALLQKGTPDVPKLNFSVVIPNQKNSSIEIIESNFVEYSNIDLAPSKGKISRSINPSDIPYSYGDVYHTNAFFPNEPATLNTPYIIRDFRGQTIQVHPVQYNPISKVMRVYSSLKIKVTYFGKSNTNVIATNEWPQKLDEVFDGIYQNQFINYLSLKKTRYSPILEEGSLLIVCPDNFLSEIAPLVKWKEMKGIKTYLVNADTITGGISESSIAATAKYYYQNMQIANMIIVGDNTFIPARNENFTNPNLAGPSDIAYAYINNNDHYPEFAVGRFSGENSSEIKSMVDRCLEYEKTPNTNGNWMSQQIGIASEQGTGDDNQYDFQHIHDIVDSNKNQYNYTNYYELYDGVQSQGWNDAAGFPDAAMLEGHINSGVSLINYAGHGGANGIVTTSFSTSEVPLLTNINKLPFFLVVGCSPGKFLNQTCFAEALLRAGNGGAPKGTLSSFMSSIDQYWDEPMQAQDEFNAIMRGARPNNLKTRLGALCVNGCSSMNDQYNTFNDPTGGSDMTDTWIFFGDPTVSLFNKNEGPLTCTHTAEIGRNATWYSVNCPVEGATIGLYYQGAYLAHSKVVGGTASFTFPPLLNLDTLFITATKQNRTPYMGFSKVVDFPTQTVDLNDDQLLSVFPNPAQEFISIRFRNGASIESVKVFDMAGHLITQQKVHQSPFVLQTQSFSKGNYSLQVTSGQKTISTQFTKK